ncbi:MAG: DNA polymerase III subunit delta' [Gammaproteobacteria bacterium]
MNNQLYPWQHEQWHSFVRMIGSNSLPHAILLSGPDGVGKHHFARNLVNTILCLQANNDGTACGQCKHCLLVEANTYPDFVRVVPEEDKNTISIDEIRELIIKLHLTRHFDTKKVALIEYADNMNTNAANALLKTLEEPPEETIIILVTSAPLNLPATIRSRCQFVPFYSPTQAQALDWLNSTSKDVEWEPLLRVAQGAPLQAIQYHETELLDQRISVIQGFLELFEANSDPIEIAARIEAIPFLQCFQWIQAVIVDLLRIKGAENPITLENPDFYRPLLALAPRMQVPLLLEFWELVLERKRIFDNSLNRRLFAESLLIRSHKLAIKHSV